MNTLVQSLFPGTTPTIAIKWKGRSMVRKSLLISALFFTTLMSAAQVPGNMNIITLNPKAWPSPAPSMMRARTGESWPDIEPQRGQYSSTFGSIDAWVAASKKHNAAVLYTLAFVPAWASSNLEYPPTDLYTSNETCMAPLAGVVRPNGDCMWAEFITAFMQHTCGVSAAPSTPLTGTCSVRYFEAWNEFNDWYWTSNYTDLAKMANDAATIVKQYCGDCVFMAGNTSAGGDGYNPNYIKNPIVSPYFDVALGQLLDAWYAIPNATLPDAVSYHAYGARDVVIPYPFPETNVSHSSALCTPTNTPNVNCRVPIFQQVAAIRTQLQLRPWAANLPIWNTEGGFSRNDDLTDGVDQSDQNTTMLRQAYIARWMLAMASSGTVANFWYQWQEPCWGTMQSLGTAPSQTNCPADPMIPAGPTAIYQPWILMNTWLSGVSFSGPCTNTGAIWRCSITKPKYHAMFMWTTSWLASTSVTIAPNYKRYRDLDGNIYDLTGQTSVTVTNRPILLEQ